MNVCTRMSDGTTKYEQDEVVGWSHICLGPVKIHRTYLFELFELDHDE